VHVDERPRRSFRAAALPCFSAGWLDFMFNWIGTTLGQRRGGQVRALAVTAAQRAPRAPDVPTLSEPSIPGVQASWWYALSAPTRTPRDIVERISADARWARAQPDVVRPTTDTPNEIVASDPDGLVRHIRAKLELWGPVIRANNITAVG
jgi:tripartite-type tricarboxylate transporter receptor subunit TctC